MTKTFRLIIMCAITLVLATFSIATAQTFRTIDYPGATATTLNGGPNPQGTSVGTYTDTVGVTHGFTLTRAGVFTAFDPSGSTATTPNFISPQGTIVGAYVDASGVSHGFILSGGQYRNMDFPGAAGTSLTSINPAGEITGFSCAVASCATGPFQSFTLSKFGAFDGFNPPGSDNSQATVVNPNGDVVGAFEDSSGAVHGYILNHGTFTTNDFPGATLTFDGGSNATGAIVGEYIDTAGVAHSFLLSGGTYTSFDPPGATLSDATGINPSGVVVGLFADSAGVLHGYIRTP